MEAIVLGNIEGKKVFISYSWSNEEHQTKVIKLAEELVNLGIDVILDVWDLKPGQDKYNFMEKMVKDPSLDKVLIITDKTYAEKANNRQGGVGTETQIITPSIYNNLGEDKFIPIIFEKDKNTGEAFLPVYAQSRIYIDLTNDTVYQEGLEQLVREIYERPTYKKPKLGNAPSYILEDKINTFNIERKADDVEHALSKGTQRVRFAIKDYFDSFIEELDKLIVKENEGEAFDAAAVRMIDESLPFRKSFIKMLNVFVQIDNIDSEFISEFFEDYSNKIFQMERKDDLAPEAVKFLLLELFICSTSIFIKYKRWEMLAHILNHEYYNKLERKTYSFGYLYMPTRFILEGSLQRMNNKSLVSDKMEKRATERDFNLMVEADMFLYYISKINPNVGVDYCVSWFPILHIFTTRLNGHMKVLNLLKSKNKLSEMLPIFGVSEEELKLKIREMKSDSGYSYRPIQEFQFFLKVEDIGIKA